MNLILIDIDNVLTVTDIYPDGSEKTTVNYDDLLSEALVTIPDNPTNGDIIKALFPNVKLLTASSGSMFFIKGEDWWKTPYKKPTVLVERKTKKQDTEI